MEPKAEKPQRLVALLRAINVGGHNVKMDELRRHFEALGYAKVETFIASGNVIFESAEKDHHAIEKDIESHLHSALGYPVATFIRSAQEITQIASYQPFPMEDLTREGNSLYIAFLQVSPDEEAQKKLMASNSAVDNFHVHGREVYWLCRIRMSESTFSGALLEKTLRMPATLRNVTTVRKLAGEHSPRINPCGF